MQKKKLFIVNYDWRDIFRTGKEEFYEKLQRDMLHPEVNDFFFFSWAKESYEHLEGSWQTVHRKTYGLEKLRPIFNLWAFYLIPHTVWKHNIRPDAWVVYDFGMVPAMWLCHKLFGGELIMYVNNQPKIYSETRKFGKVKGVYSWVAERIGVRFVKHYFTINEAMCKYLGKLGVKREQITIYNVNTINRDREHIPNAKKGTVRKRYKIAKDKKMLLTVARLEAEKNYPLLLDLFSGLSKDHVLICLGEGSLRPILEKQTEKLDIADRVFFPGFVERDDIWNYFKDADVFVLISKAEALGIVFWEAMYVNVPCIGSDVEGIKESLGDSGERGVIWKEESGQQGFNDLVEFCTTESKERDKMVKEAKEFVEIESENTATINDFLDSLKKDTA